MPDDRPDDSLINQFQSQTCKWVTNSKLANLQSKLFHSILKIVAQLRVNQICFDEKNENVPNKQN